MLLFGSSFKIQLNNLNETTPGLKGNPLNLQDRQHYSCLYQSSINSHQMTKKKWGQNFLIHNNVAETIVEAADVHNGDSILEIGPGRGMLTRSLLERGAQVTAIEVDPALCEKLRKQFEHEARFTLIDQDIMKVSPEDLAKIVSAPAKVVANLPYNIATPLLVRMLFVRKAWQSLTIMVQLEVAERICASPDSGKIYGPLSLVGALGFERNIIKIISPDSFRPAPKVDSAIIQLIPHSSSLTHEEEKQFLKWSHLLFQQRRKTLLNGIRRHFPEWFQNCENSLREKYGLRRPESLDFSEWLMLFSDYLQKI